MMRRLPYIALIVVCATLWGSCEEDIYAPEWTKIDYEQFLNDIEAPTGALVGGDIDTTVEVLEDYLGDTPELVEDVQLLYNQLEVMLDVLEESQEQEYQTNTSEKGEVRGTNIYGRISCLGPDPLNRDIGFQYGEIRLEGAQFSLDDALKSGFDLGGDILAAFRECRMGDRTMRGFSPAFASTRNAEVLLDLDLAVEKNNGSEHTLRYPILVRRTRVFILADTGETGTYLLSIAFGRNTVITMTTAQGTVGCSIGVSGLECDDLVATEN